ncbi:MAG TPA: hypothetical protein VFV72_03250 [Candidatus Limnocylindrales bacterium]|nr:hypothetical protein [Candidatus Limnocylindrales bacterium]
MGPGRRPTLLAALLLAGNVAAGCGTSAGPQGPSASTATTPAPAASSPAESGAAPSAVDLPPNGRIELADRGFAVTIPENWLSVDLSDEGVQEALDDGLDQFGANFDENLAQQVQNAIKGGVALLAFRDPDDDAPAGTNINVIVLPAYGMSLDTLVTVNKAQLKQLAGVDGPINSENITLPAGEAAVLTYELTPEGQDPVSFEQYFLVGDEKQVILTCTVLAGGAIGDECRSIAETVEILE